MALNPLRAQVLTTEEQREVGDRPASGSFTMYPPGHEEFSRLQELLAQALKREAEAHRKMKHLHEQLLDMKSPRTRSCSDGSQSATPDILWDSELSQTSEGSPQSPLAVIVVSGSPALARKNPSPSVAPAIFPELQMSNHHSNQNGGHFPGRADSLEKFYQPPPEQVKQVTMETLGKLAPSPQDFRGVRHEREKPPPSLSPVMSPSSTFAPERPVSASPPATLHQLGNRELYTFHSMEDKEDDKFTQSLGGRGFHVASAAAGGANVGRSNSIKEKKKQKVGHRSRANTTNLLPQWIRRRRGGGVTNSSRALHKPPVDSIEAMFAAFVRTTNISIQQEHFTAFIDRHWSDVCKDSTCLTDIRKYRDAVWDLFQTEAKFLTRFLQPLQQVYKGFLEELHFHGVLKVADVDKIFANLSELCELSSSVASDFFMLFDGRSGGRIAPNKELILSFSMFGHKFNPVYQRFCVNFEKQRGFVRALEQLPDFMEYLRVCRNHESVGKNDLSALLIAPMKHQCHYQLLLEKVLKYTKSKAEKELLSSAIKAFVVSLKELEANIAENKRSAEVLELQETLCWPTLSQLEPTAYIPESLSSRLSCQPCSYELASKERQLVFKGTVKLLDSSKHSRDMVAFLFTDSLLLTQRSAQTDRKLAKKEQSRNQLIRYCVFGHPLLLTMLDIHDIPSLAQGGQGPNHVITLVERNLFQQQVGIYSLQSSSKDEKAKWLSQLSHTKNIICYRNSPSFVESDV